MMELNIPLLRKTIEYIEEHPAEWNQDSWAERRPGCGTTMCFAGTAAFLSGADLVWGMVVDGQDVEFSEAVMCRTEGDKLHDIEKYAAELLGLTVSQADSIFYSNPKTPQEMRERVEEVIGQAL